MAAVNAIERGYRHFDSVLRGNGRIVRITGSELARHVNQPHQIEKDEKDAARRTAFTTFANTVKAIFGSRTVLAR